MKKKFIVRGENSGVFYGEIKARLNQEVIMANVRRICYWKGAASISQLSAEGVKNPDECTISMPVKELVLLDAIEIIPCTTVAKTCLDGVKEWKA